ncbi:type II and III secretion system protein family protein [Amaricoccus macauensis]|uniref:type II and III secretion system protein family protein n=1 Tax=Amaricoccus macauensis TaxID=57001 RepID=UPI003C7ECABE
MMAERLTRIAAKTACASAIALTCAMVPVPLENSAAAFELVEPATERSVSLVIGTGQLIRVDEPFSSLFVANPDVADIEVKSPRLLYLTGVGVGETTLFAVDEADNVLMSSVIKVTHNTGALATGIKRVAPGQSVTATTVDQSLVLTGTVQSPEQAADVMNIAAQFVDDESQVVNRLNIATPTQVNLQVRIAEVNREVDRQLGINWQAANFGGGGVTVGFAGGDLPGGGYSAGASINRGGFQLDVILNALSEEGMVTILAEPNLTARSGESANFLAGGEYPFAVWDEDEDHETIYFKDYGIGLSFTPTVLDKQRISLKVETEVSDLSFAENVDYPSLVTRRAETTVDLASGQSFAIAGLMQNSTSQDESRVPGLGRLPILGALFKSSGYNRGQTELVILVTPVIVEPTTPNRVATPVDNYVPPNDFERILLGRFQGDRRKVTEVQNSLGRRRLYGSSGFEFD